MVDKKEIDDYLLGKYLRVLVKNMGADKTIEDIEFIQAVCQVVIEERDKLFNKLLSRLN